MTPDHPSPTAVLAKANGLSFCPSRLDLGPVPWLGGSAHQPLCLQVAPCPAQLTAYFQNDSSGGGFQVVEVASYLRVEANAGPSKAARGSPDRRLRSRWEPTVWDYSDGTGPIGVPEGATVLITVKFQALPGLAAACFSAQLAIDADAWATVLVPVRASMARPAGPTPGLNALEN
jgi:hypothetical protein